ncbi:MAG TPA: DUF2550 domain-containing protein [Mycobacteriales bacterium]|nr:DUF2550 domain-containing protein [Mycobacteriales bacterium]
MEVVDAIGVLVLIAALLLGLLVLRRLFLTRRGGCLGISLRRAGAGRHGWVLGLGRLERDRLVWFRLFSFSLRPRHAVDRSALAVLQRRRPSGGETLMLPGDAVIFRCDGVREALEVALPESTLPAFLAWLESAPPGASLPR